MQARTPSLADCRTRLVENGIRPSYQRMLIYRNLVARCDHPTAEQVHAGLLAEIPTLSRTTVYSTLGLFSRSGLIRMPPLGDGEARYDGRAAFHAHSRCLGCGAIGDLECPEPRPAAERGFSVLRTELVLEGYCGKCRS